MDWCKVCVAQGAPCKRAGRQWVRCARGSTRPLRRSAPCYVLPCRAAQIRSPPQRLWASSWCPPHSTAQAAACRFVDESGAGGRWSRARWSREHCGCRLRCSSVGNVWWWGVAMAVGSAPERGDGGEVPSSDCGYTATDCGYTAAHVVVVTLYTTRGEDSGYTSYIAVRSGRFLL